MSEVGGRPQFGVAALVDVPLKPFARRAWQAEDLGFDQFWVPDERLLRNVYVSLATAANATTTIGLGTAVTNPYTRNPAIAAAAAATVDELSGGRTILGLGAGGGLEPYGVDRRNPVGYLRDMTAIVRGLTSGGDVTHAGRHLSVTDAHLDFPAVRQIPVYIAARGARTLALAGEIADGVIIGGFASPDGIRYAREQVARGLAVGGRRWSDLQAVGWIFISVSDDRGAARDAVSRMVLAALVSSRPILDQLGLDLRPTLIAQLDAAGWRYPEDAGAIAALLDDDVLDTFSVYGTPEECVERLAGLAGCGLDQIVFVIQRPAGSTVEEVMVRLAEEVMPDLRQAAAFRITGTRP